MLNVIVSIPPLFPVTSFAVVQFFPSVDVWILYDSPYAASQLSTTLLTAYVFPKSTAIHASSAKFDDHLVPSSPSNAFAAAIASVSVPDVDAVLPLATFTNVVSPSSGFEGSVGCSGSVVLPPLIV